MATQRIIKPSAPADVGEYVKGLKHPMARVKANANTLRRIVKEQLRTLEK